MRRKDWKYWHRLRKDVPTAIAVLATVLGLAPVVVAAIVLAQPGTPQDLGPGLIPLALGPFLLGWYLDPLFRYEAKRVWLIRPAFVFCPAACAMLTVTALLLEIDLTANLCLLAASLAIAVTGEVAYRRSMLKLEGPAQ